MQYRTMKDGGDKLSVLGFGCMRFPTKGRKIQEEPASELLMQAYKAGVNYFDTAVPYHFGSSEAFLGRFLAKHNLRSKVYIATKLPHWQTSSEEAMFSMLQKQLKNLQTEYIDYYLVHNLHGASWDGCVQKGVISFLDKAKEQGLIRHVGFSFHGVVEDFKRIVDAYPWDFTQIQYNILDQRYQAGTEGLDYAAKKGLGIIVMEPLRGGNLAEPIPEEVQTLWNSSDIRRTPVEWALRWIWNRSELHVLLSGMSLPEHVEENTRIADTAYAHDFSDAEASLVDAVADTYRRLMKVSCTSCRYCMPCPFGVNIPDIFVAYNEYHFFHKGLLARLQYMLSFGAAFGGKSSYASQCTACGVCLKKCPQNIPIPEALTSAKKDLELGFLRPLLRFARIFLAKTKRKDTE